MTPHAKSLETWRGMCIRVVILRSLSAAAWPCLAQAPAPPVAFVVVESQFHARDPEDAGEVRLCLRNTGTASFSALQLAVHVVVRKPNDPDAVGQEQKYVYVRLWPPVVPLGQCGQLVAKLFDRPARDCTLLCTVSAAEGATSHTVPAREPAVWISYIGFSQDLRKICVYVENVSDEVVRLESLRVGEDKVEGPTVVVHRLISPRDKGCLTGRLPAGVTPGEFLHLTVSARKGDQDVRVHSIVRAINRVPLLRVESGPPIPNVGLDLEGFTETMTCIAHAHGTHEQAAGEFLEDYGRRSGRNPHRVIQLEMCRGDSPRAWFRFGSLPDVARINPVLPPPSNYDQQDRRQWFSPFLYRGHLAKKAVEPCRYLAVMPLIPEEGLFLRKELTPPEMRFLVYCSIASGAKGLAYRGALTDDPLNRNAFVRLNKELRQVEPLLLIGEPVEWATTMDSRYAVQSLLCGDQTILVMVFDRWYFSQQRSNKFGTPSFGRAMTQVKVDVQIPGEIAVGQVRSLSAPLDRGSWIYGESGLSFTISMIDSVQIYLVDLELKTRRPGAGEQSL